MTLACAHFAISTVANHRSFLELARYAAGTEHTPYQYRVLMMGVMRLLGGSTPVVRLAHSFPEPLNEPYTFVLLAIDFLALLGAVQATRRALDLLTQDPPFSRWASLLVVFAAYFQFALPYGLNYVLPYDLPGVLVFSLAFLALVARNRPLFYAVFAIGTLNRETTILLLVPLVVWELFSSRGEALEGGRRRAALHTVALLALWFGVKLLIARTFAGRTPLPGDGGLFETHLKGNLASILKPYQWPLLASLFGFTLPILVRYRNLIDDFRLRRSLEIMVPLWAVAMFVVGVFVEVRVFGELIAPVALGLALIARHWMRTPPERAATA